MKHCNCWAATLGDCSNTISGEHIITEAIHDPDRLLNVERGAASSFRTARANFTSNMLCTAHNSKLSVADDEAVKLYRGLQSIHALKPGSSCLNVAIDADRFESWLTKTMINSVVSGISTIAKSNPRRQAPVERRLIEIAFGLRTFSNGGGAYVVSRVESAPWGSNYHFAPILADGKHVCGMVFRFCPLWFVLWASDRPLMDGVAQLPYVEGYDISPLSGVTEIIVGDYVAGTIGYERANANQ